MPSILCEVSRLASPQLSVEYVEVCPRVGQRTFLNVGAGVGVVMDQVQRVGGCLGCGFSRTEKLRHMEARNGWWVRGWRRGSVKQDRIK